MATTGHIRKRQYQPSITSYFNNSPSSSAPPTLQRTTSSPLSPPLPAETQASLLSVGMRVRKSVPEGYKTHKTMDGVQGFPFPSSAPPTRRKRVVASPRELTPFCGLHKVAGWGVQEIPSSSAPAELEMEGEEDEEDVPELMQSQRTFTSTQGSFVSSMGAGDAAGASRKRTYEDEVEEGMDAYFDEIEADEALETHRHALDRPMARMKGSGAKGSVRIVANDGFSRVDDFEEAPFLTPPDRMDIDLR